MAKVSRNDLTSFLFSPANRSLHASGCHPKTYGTEKNTLLDAGRQFLGVC